MAGFSMRAAAAALLAVAAAGVTGCGGGGGGSTTPQDAGAKARAARLIPPGVTITRTETGPARAAGQGMTPLRTAAAAREECAMFHLNYLAGVYGGFSDDADSVAFWFAQRRAAPGALEPVRRGCRAGLHA